MTAIRQARVSEIRGKHRSDGQKAYKATKISLSESVNIGFWLDLQTISVAA